MEAPSRAGSNATPDGRRAGSNITPDQYLKVILRIDLETGDPKQRLVWECLESKKSKARFKSLIQQEAHTDYTTPHTVQKQSLP